jgi:hypothetical protein
MAAWILAFWAARSSEVGMMGLREKIGGWGVEVRYETDTVVTEDNEVRLNETQQFQTPPDPRATPGPIR